MRDVFRYLNSRMRIGIRSGRVISNGNISPKYNQQDTNLIIDEIDLKTIETSVFTQFQISDNGNGTGTVQNIPALDANSTVSSEITIEEFQ